MTTRLISAAAILLSAIVAALVDGRAAPAASSAPAANALPALSAESFAQPTDEFAPRGWWHWIDGNISREGITKDLEALHAAGIQHVTIFDLGLRMPTGPVKEVLSEDWFAMVRFAASEARRLGMKLGLTIHPGFSGAGGPWITPEMSMKHLVWSDTIVDGGQAVDVVLPPLPVGNAWSRDYAVVAWPVAGKFATGTPERLTFNGTVVPANVLADGNPFTRLPCPKASASWRLEFSFAAQRSVAQARLLFGAVDHVRIRNAKPYVLRVRDGEKVLAQNELAADAFAAPIEISFPATTSSHLTVEIAPQDGAFNFTGGLFLAEAELLSVDERPRWPGAIRDWDRQIGDGDGAPQDGGSFSAHAADQAFAPADVHDLTAAVHDGKLQWTPPAGSWRIVRFGYASIGKQVRPSRAGGQGLESDKLSFAATDLAFQGYAQKVLEALPPADRGVFNLLFIDSWECGKQNWTDDFPAAFAAHRAYSLTPYLPILAGEIVASPEITARFLNDFRETIADLVTERFYGHAEQLAQKAGLRLEAQIGDGQGVDPDWDVFALARVVDLPMDEFWSEPDTERYPRAWQLADAAYLAGGKLVTTESFTGRRADWRNTPGDLDQWAQIAYQRGIGQFAFHSTVHQPGGKPPGFTLGGNGEHFTRTNTWWPFVGDWMEGIRRAHYLVRASELDAEFLAYNGDTMPRPPALWPASYASPHRQFIDRPALLSRVTVRDGRLQLDGKGSFRALVLPRTPSLKADALAKIADLVRAGAIVIGLPPVYATGLGSAGDDTRVRELRAMLWNTTPPNSPKLTHFGAGAVLGTDNPKEALASLGFAGDVTSSTKLPAQQPIEYSHRRAGDADIYFLLNPNQETTDFTCHVLDVERRQPELWWAQTGRAQPVPAYSHAEGHVTFSVTLEGRAGVFLILRQPAPAMEPRDRRAPVAAPATPIAFTSPWRLTFGPLASGRTIDLPQLASWTTFAEPLLRDYSGTVIYENEFTVSPTAITAPVTAKLDLGDVANVARVSINGRVAGTRWRTPWTFEIGGLLHAGANTIRLEVANLWQNRVLADLKLPLAERVTWTTPLAENFIKASPPLPSGILGPVTLTIAPASTP